MGRNCFLQNPTLQGDSSEQTFKKFFPQCLLNTEGCRGCLVHAQRQQLCLPPQQHVNYFHVQRHCGAIPLHSAWSHGHWSQPTSFPDSLASWLPVRVCPWPLQEESEGAEKQIPAFSSSSPAPAGCGQLQVHPWVLPCTSPAGSQLCPPGQASAPCSHPLHT